MWEQYKETFDGVHASQRLKTEVLNMKREENATKWRRVPAALVAILVVVLAGTAVAVERLASAGVIGYAEIGQIDGDHPGGKVELIDGNPENGISIRTFTSPFPVENLSDAVLERATYAGETIDGECGEILPFDSWSEAEDFLGLKVADNARLDQMEPRMLADGEPEIWGNCLLELTYANNAPTPNTISLVAGYQENDIKVNTLAFLSTKTYLEDGYGVSNTITSDRWKAAERYVTPSGLETIIITVADSTGRGDGCFGGDFVRNNIHYTVFVKGELTDSQSSAGILDTLKEILDAYE